MNIGKAPSIDKALCTSKAMSTIKAHRIFLNHSKGHKIVLTLQNDLPKYFNQINEKNSSKRRNNFVQGLMNLAPT